MIAAGGGAPSATSSSARNSAVGALPTTTSEPASRSRQSSSAAAVRVVSSSAASAGTRGSPSVQTTSLPAGSRERVTPEATIRVSHRTGAPAWSAAVAAPAKPGEASTSPARSTIPQAWIIRTTARSSTGSKPARSASARMIANDRR